MPPRKPVLLGRQAVRQLREEYRRTKALVRPVQGKMAAIPQVSAPYTQWVALTSNTAASGYYPGVWKRQENDGTFTTMAAVWVREVNGATLTTGNNYLGREEGDALVSAETRRVFAVEAGGGGSFPWTSTGLTVEQESGGTPETGTTTLAFDQAQGFAVTSGGTGIADVTITSASVSQTGVVIADMATSTEQAFSGVKRFANKTTFGPAAISGLGSVSGQFFATHGTGADGYLAIYNSAGGVTDLTASDGGSNGTTLALIPDATNGRAVLSGGTVGNNAFYAVLDNFSSVEEQGKWGTNSIGDTISGGLVTAIGSSPVSLGDGGTGTSLSDPGVDRLLGFAFTAGGTPADWIGLGTNLVLDVSGVLQIVDGTNNAGYVLTSNGSGSPATFQAAGASGTVTNVATSGSLTGGPVTTTGTLSLAGDNATPGNSYYYGTDGTGTKGFFPQDGGTWVRVTKLYSDFAFASTSHNFVVGSVAATQVILYALMKHSTSFTGGGAASVSLGLQTAKGPLLNTLDVFQAPGDTVFADSPNQTGLGVQDFGAAKDVIVTAFANVNLNLLTAGSVDIWLLVTTLR